MPSIKTVKCVFCKNEFQARTVDIKRGWGKFCSKSCKAKWQEKKTGQYADLIVKERFLRGHYDGEDCF